MQRFLTVWPEQPEEPTWDLTNLWNQAAIYACAAGRAAEARTLFEAALSVCRRVLGEEHPDTLTSMNNLALTLSALGDAAGGLDLHDAALSVRRRVLGEQHPHTLISMHWLCFTQQKSDGVEVDRLLLKRLLQGVRALPEGTPIRVAAEARCSRNHD